MSDEPKTMSVVAEPYSFDPRLAALESRLEKLETENAVLKRLLGWEVVNDLTGEPAMVRANSLFEKPHVVTRTTGIGRPEWEILERGK